MILQLAFILAQVPVPPGNQPQMPQTPIAVPSPPIQPPAEPPAQLPPAGQPSQPPPAAKQPAPQPAVQVQGQASANANLPTYQGTLTSVTNGQAQVKFADGTTKTFAINSADIKPLNASAGKPIAFRIVNGTMQVAQDVKWGTLTAVSNGKATLQEADKQTATLSVDAATQAQLKALLGQAVAFTVNGDSMTLATPTPPQH